MQNLRWYVPTTWSQVLSRSALRVFFCAIPYLLIALLFARSGDERLLHGPMFWWIVVVIPAGGLLIDLWRLARTSRRGGLKIPGSIGSGVCS